MTILITLRSYYQVLTKEKRFAVEQLVIQKIHINKVNKVTITFAKTKTNFN